VPENLTTFDARSRSEIALHGNVQKPSYPSGVGAKKNTLPYLNTTPLYGRQEPLRENYL